MLLIGVYLHKHLIVCSAITDCDVIYNRLENKCIFIDNFFDSFLLKDMNISRRVKLHFKNKGSLLVSMVL